MSFFQRNIIVISFVLLVILIGIGTLLVSFHNIRNWSLNEARERVLNDLNTACHIFDNEQKENQSILTGIVLKNSILQNNFTADNREKLTAILQNQTGIYPLDVLVVTDENGRVFASVFNTEQFKETVNINKAVSRVIETGKPVRCTQLVSSESFLEKANILRSGFSYGYRSMQRTDDETDSGELPGLMIVAGVPLMNDEGALSGVLAGGKLIINEDSFRDSAVTENINKIIFSDELYKSEASGVTAFYVRDVSVPIIIKDSKGEVIETLTSDDISGKAGEDLKPWVDYALIDNSRYLIGYDDIRNIRGEVIGMLAVEMRENIFTNRASRRMLVFSGITCIWMIIVLVLFVLITRKVINIGSTLKIREKEYNELIKQVNESKRLVTLGQLAAGVAHEVNNPLTGVIVYSHLLLEDTDKDDPRHSNIKKVIRESHRCKNIVKSLLDFARQSKPNLEPLDVNKIVIEALNNMQQDPLFEHVQIVENFSRYLPSALADNSQIQQVFANIIRNASEIMEGSGKLVITIGVVHDDNGKRFIEINFEDTGPGIPPEHLERIFDPFFTTKSKGHGTGLGLAVCYGIIERHEGTIRVWNSEEGGAVFSVWLPVREEK